METYIKKMTEIIKKHYKDNHKYIFLGDAELKYCTMVNGDIHAIFYVGNIYTEMYLYKVIYYQDIDKFRVLYYKLEELFDVDEDIM